MRPMSRVRATTRRLNASVTTKIVTRHDTVRRRASSEKKKWKVEICALNIEAVKNVMTHETPTPRSSPSTSAAPETMAVSRAMIRAARPRVMPSTW